MDALAVVLMVSLIAGTMTGATRLEGFLQSNGVAESRARQARILSYGLAVLFAAILIAYIVVID